MKVAGSYYKLLRQPHFVFYLLSLFLGAFNDNSFKTIVLLIALKSPSSGHVDKYFLLAQLVFILPYLLFSGYSGYLSDIFAKNKVFISTKIFEIFIMSLGLYFLPVENKPMLIVILFLLSTQSVFFSPAKYGLLPEIFSEEDLSRANGVLELATFSAIIFGAAFGGIILQFYRHNYFMIAVILLLFSIIGTVASFGIKKVSRSGAQKKFNINPWQEVMYGINALRNNSVLALTILGISFFFAIALVITTNLLVFGKELLNLNSQQLGLLNATIGFGIGIGSWIAGSLSGDKIEYGLIPLGSIGMTIGCFWLALATSSVATVYIALGFSGLMAGLFIVPLNALLQELPSADTKGRMIATNNFFNGIGMIIGILLLWFFQAEMQLAPNNIMFVFALIILAFNIVTFLINPLFFIRFILWLFVHIFYRVRLFGRPSVPYKGPALIISNKRSALDGLLISILLPRFVKYVVDKEYFKRPILGLLLKLSRAIPIDYNDINSRADSIRKIRESLIKGNICGLFFDERINHIKAIPDLDQYVHDITDGLEIPIIPVNINQFWDSFAVLKNGKNRLSWPQQLPVRLVVAIGKALPMGSRFWEAKQVIDTLAVQAQVADTSFSNYLATEFVKISTTYPFKKCYITPENKSYSYKQVSNRVLVLARHLKQYHKQVKTIGICLPPGIDAICINIAAVIANKTVFNLANLAELDNLAADQLKSLGLKSIYTSRQQIKPDSNNINFNYTGEFIYIEDLKKLKSFDNKNFKFIVNILKYLLSAKLIVKLYGNLPEPKNDIVAVFINKNNNNKLEYFSSRQLYYLISGIKQSFNFNRSDKIYSSNYYNNNFYYINTLWLPLLIGSTIIFGDNKFFSSLLNNLAVNSNRLKLTKQAVFFHNNNIFLLKNFNKQFNIINFKQISIDLLGIIGVVDTTIEYNNKNNYYLLYNYPGIVLKLVDKNTGEDLSINQFGILQVQTAVMLSGSPRFSWYQTNIVAIRDNDGNIYINLQ